MPFYSSDQYQGTGTTNLRWACWLGEVQDVGVVEVVVTVRVWNICLAGLSIVNRMIV